MSLFTLSPSIRYPRIAQSNNGLDYLSEAFTSPPLRSGIPQEFSHSEGSLFGMIVPLNGVLLLDAIEKPSVGVGAKFALQHSLQGSLETSERCFYLRGSVENVISGHTHQPLQCTIVLNALNYSLLQV
jgi:hypothetical protein